MLRKVLTVALVPMLLGVPATAPSAAADQRTCRGLEATIVGTAGDDRITGTRRADVIVARGGNDTIDGLAGDDVLCGGGGADDVIGGRGHDRLYGGHDQHEPHGRRTVITGDLLEGGPGDDHLSAGRDERTVGRIAVQRPDTISYRHSGRAVTVDLHEGVALGEGSDVVVAGRSLQVDGSRLDDVLHGSPRAEILDGGRGDDQVFGGGGADAVLGYHGHDQLHGEQGDDWLFSTAGGDTVDGGDGADYLDAWSPAPTTLLGGAGFDYMSRQITSGETGVIDGGPDGNQLELDPQLWPSGDLSGEVDAQAGTVVLTADAGTHATGFANVRAFTLWGIPWTLHGTEGDDFVQTLSGPLDAQGFGGDDVMVGAGRNDVLDGGDGTDKLWGGNGRNTCLNAEAGSCTGYPWDTTTTRARVVAARQTPLGDTPPRLLVSRWLDHRSPLPAD